MSKEFTLTEVQSHNTEDDLYFVIHGKVYNSTSFVSEHPGGGEILVEVAGTDATEAYVDAEHSEEADEILADLLIGTLKLEGAAADEVPPQDTDKTVDELPVAALKIDDAPAADASTQTTNGVVETVLKPDAFQEFPLQEKTVISHNVAIYRFTLPTPESVVGLPIGQHISIGAHLPQPDGETKEIIRSYTPISGDHQRGYFDLLIKSYPLGNISKYFTTLSIGDNIRVRGPKGAFVYTPNMVRHFAMIAGGTGITPMLQVIRAIQRGRAGGDKTEVDLIFANVNAEDILLKDELDALTKEDAGIRVHYVLNNPPEGWIGGVGFVSADMMTKWLPKPAADVKMLLCGPPPMISAMKKISESLGFEKARPVSKLDDQVFAF